MITEIQSYSLIEFDIGNQTYSIHPLVHAWIHTMISSDEAIRASTQWILGMSITWGEHSEDYAFRQSLQSHMDTVLEDRNSAGPEFYERFGGVYSEVGRWKAAEKLYVQARDAALGVHRAEHRYSVGHGEACDNVLESRMVKGGRELGLQVRDGCLKVLGAEHPDTLLAMGVQRV